MSNFVTTWAQTANDLDLTTVFSPDLGEIVIFNSDHPDKGFMWIKNPQQVTFCDFQGNAFELTPDAAFAQVGKMRSV